MHSVIGWKAWLTAALVVCVGIIAVRLGTGAGIVQALQGGVSLTSLLVTGFVSTAAWRLLWLLPFFQRKAPPLDGEWSGAVSSNWSIVERLKDAAKQAGGAALDVDALASPLPELLEVPVTARIRTTFAGIHLELESADHRYQVSSLKVVELKPATEAGDAVLSYVFEGRVLSPVPGDVTTFDGAASLIVKKDAHGHLCLSGPTWTNRAWSRGLNTAGVLRLKRIRSDFWEPLKFGLGKR
jgi:hypothetical protein